MISVMLVSVIEALDQSIADAAGHCHRQMTLIKVETGFNHSVLNVIDDLFLDKPAFMTEVGAHQAPELGVHVLFRLAPRRQRRLMHPVVNLLLVLKLRLYQSKPCNNEHTR